MKQIWPDYSYSPATNVLTLTGLNIDRDQLLLVAAPERGRIMYNFADSAVTASAYTAGANTALTLVASTAGLTTTASLVIYYDDQSTAITISNFPATQPVSIASVTIGNTVTIGSLPAISGTVTANLDSNSSVIASQVENGIAGYAADVANDPFPIAGTVTVGAGTAQIGSVTASISGTVSLGNGLGEGWLTNELQRVYNLEDRVIVGIHPTYNTIRGTVTIGSLPALVAGTAQIGSVTASISNSITIGSLPAISGTVTANVGSILGFNEIYLADPDNDNRFSSSYPFPISGTVTVGNSVTIGSLPAISGTVTANTFAVQGTAVTTSDFTSTTASTVLASFNATREVLTIFNEGAGNLFVCPGATCTTVQYQVRLSSGDYYEVPNHQTTITHSAVFATAGTARVTEVS